MCVCERATRTLCVRVGVRVIVCVRMRACDCVNAVQQGVPSGSSPGPTVGGAEENLL